MLRCEADSHGKQKYKKYLWLFLSEHMEEVKDAEDRWCSYVSSNISLKVG